jgi:hypothetical protein
VQTEELVVVLVPFAVLALVWLRFAFRGLAEESRAHKSGSQPRPGLRAATDWAGTLGIFCALVALVLMAQIGGRQEGVWRLALLLAVNLMVQPICLLFLAGGVYSLAQALRGRFTYAFRVIPREEFPAEEYRGYLRLRVMSGIVAVLFGAGLSAACLCPAL